jgi:hypothetical protein
MYKLNDAIKYGEKMNRKESKKWLKINIFILFSLLLVACSEKENSEWIQLFNGKNLDGWHVKITGYDLDDNFGNTFRVENGIMKVSYDAYDTFDGRFGHIFYKDIFSHYRLRVEYRFTGEQVPGGPGWAFRNSGVMFHSQSPQSMKKDQNFPVSIEAQYLGGDGQTKRPTANVCTPGTHIVMNGDLIKRHCISSTSKTYHGDQWVTVEIEVRGDALVKHIVDGQVVLSYEKPQLDSEDPEAQQFVKNEEVLLKEGYLALQAESHPIEFRKVELMVLN